MGPSDGTTAPKQVKPPSIRRPVAPASARAYVPFVPPGRSSAHETAPELSPWTRICGRTGFTAAGMGIVCLVVALTTGGRGPAPYLVLPLLILGAAAGCTGLAVSSKYAMAGWRFNGATVLVAVLGLCLVTRITPVRPAADPSGQIRQIADRDSSSDQSLVSPTPDSTPATAATKEPISTLPAVVTDQMIVARADALLRGEPGFGFSTGWVAAGRSGSAAVSLSGVDPAGPQFQALRQALPMNVSVVAIAVDNSGGTGPVHIDPEFFKAVSAAGTTVNALSPRLVLSTATHDADLFLKKYGRPIDVAAGAKLEQAVVFFPGNLDVTKLHGITFTANGTLMTFRGHVMTAAEKASLVAGK